MNVGFVPVCLTLSVEVEDESGALGELGIDVEVTVHLQGHLFADGESEAVASGEVANLKEWLEDVFTLQFYVYLVRNEKKGISVSYFI